MYVKSTKNSDMPAFADGSGNDFIGKRSANSTLNELIRELEWDYLDEKSIYELIVGLRQRHPANKAIKKMSAALGLESKLQ